MTTDYERACWLIQAYWPHRHDPTARGLVYSGIYRARAYRHSRRRYGRKVTFLQPNERARIRHAAGVH